MIQLRVVSGAKAGDQFICGEFPVTIGRAADSGFVLQDAGVWDHHAELNLSNECDFHFRVFRDAIASVNGSPTREAIIRNGDILELGAARLQFWFCQTRQGSLRIREALTWAGLVILSAAQVALIWSLLQ